MASDQPSRLIARPGPGPEEDAALAPGLGRLGLQAGRDALVHIPRGLSSRQPAPLLVSLHGAGSSAAAAVPAPLLERADAVGAVVLAPDSRGRTWDVLLGGYGPDVAFIDAALKGVFAAVSIDPERVVISGFSDGASYALSLGLSNGDLFTHVVAFSPGFMAPDTQRGEPPVFISHGTADPVLQIDHCSRALVPLLEQAGYEVAYVEFAGGHEVPPEVLERAFSWAGLERAT